MPDDENEDEEFQNGRKSMKSAWLLVGLASAAVAAGVFAQEMDFNKVEIVTQQLGPNVYMLDRARAVSIRPTRMRPAAGSACSRDRTASS